MYLGADVYHTYFADINSVILLERTPDILIMPVQQQGAGGLLLKIKNLKGDRVVNASEFFHSVGVSHSEDRLFCVQWSSEYSALTFTV